MRFLGERFWTASLWGESERDSAADGAARTSGASYGGHDLLVKLSDENGGEGCNGCDYVGYFQRGL